LLKPRRSAAGTRVPACTRQLQRSSSRERESAYFSRSVGYPVAWLAELNVCCIWMPISLHAPAAHPFPLGPARHAWPARRRPPSGSLTTCRSWQSSSGNYGRGCTRALECRGGSERLQRIDPWIVFPRPDISPRSPRWRVDVALKLARLGCGNQSQSGSQSP